MPRREDIDETAPRAERTVRGSFAIDQWKELERRDKEAKRVRRAELAQIVRTSPVSGAVLPELAWMLQPDLEEIMRGHPGWHLEERYASLRIVLQAFNTAVADLNAVLDRFHVASDDPRFLTRGRRGELEAIEHVVRKELFAASGLAHALVDHCRRFRKAAAIPGFDEHLIAAFDAGEHAFVTGLRTTIHHQRFIAPDWALRWGPGREDEPFRV